MKKFLGKILFGKWSFFWKIPAIFWLVVHLTEFFEDFLLNVGLIFLKQNRFAWVQSYIVSPEQWEIFTNGYWNIFYETGLNLLVFQLLSLLIVFVFIFIVDRYSRENIGMTFDMKNIFLVLGGILTSTLILSLLILILFLTGNLEYRGFAQEVVVGNLQSMLTIQAIIYILVSFHEELLARAYYLNILKGIGNFLSVIVSSAIFAFYHLGNVGVIIGEGFGGALWQFVTLKLSIDSYVGIFNLFLLAALFAIYFVYFKDLWFLIGAHFMWNFYMGSVWGMTVSNIATLQGSILDTQLKGHVLITGGEFGPEASIIKTGILSVIMILVISMIRKNNKKNTAIE